MKTIENVTIYKCDFCKKELKRKHAMIKHENTCSQNPNNFKACDLCKYLKQIPHSYFVDGYNGETEVKTTKFHCDKLNIDMYPYKAEKRGFPEKYPETFEDQKPMPKKCDLFVGEWIF